MWAKGHYDYTCMYTFHSAYLIILFHQLSGLYDILLVDLSKVGTKIKLIPLQSFTKIFVSDCITDK